MRGWGQELLFGAFFSGSGVLGTGWLVILFPGGWEGLQRSVGPSAGEPLGRSHTPLPGTHTFNPLKDPSRIPGPRFNLLPSTQETKAPGAKVLAVPGWGPLRGWVGMEAPDLTVTWPGQHWAWGTLGESAVTCPRKLSSFSVCPSSSWGAPWTGLLLVRWEEDSPRGAPGYLSSWIFHGLPR